MPATTKRRPTRAKKAAPPRSKSSASRQRRIPKGNKANRILRHTLLPALIILQIIIILIFIAEPDSPPTSTGVFRALYVDNRRHLVYAFLTLITLAPLLTLIHFTIVNRRRRVMAVIQLSIIWLIFCTLVGYHIPQKFTAVAAVTWQYVIEPQIDELEMVTVE